MSATLVGFRVRGVGVASGSDRWLSRRARTAVGLLTVLVATLPGAAAFGADQFQKPTQEELTMKALPGYPGAAAVVLYREEITKDDLHSVLHYERIKVLTEEGKKYANVELSYVSTSNTSEFSGDDKTVESIIGRTIHPDGTVIPFTGKPYLKTIEKTQGARYQAKVFTLPDVEVGSILEYRYATRYNDNVYEAPDWYIQGDLFVKSAHYTWSPTTRELADSRGMINTISWFPLLPPGAKIERRELPGSMGRNPQQTYELAVSDIPPVTKEEYMPPIANYSYRVYFNFSSYRTADEFWKGEGKEWSKKVDAFSNPNGELTAATQTVIAGAATAEEKLHKIYAAVMTLENTDFTRSHEQREDKANGLGKLNNAAEVLAHKRGDSTQLTELFAGMARAAGLKADLMLVPDRSKGLFIAGWLNLHQLDDLIAVVSLDGKDVFFDPGSRFCAYKHLAWEHTFVQGLRQKDGGTTFEKTAGESYGTNRTMRVANLNVNANGEFEGKVDLTFTGSAALRWRQDALRGDEESLKHDLRTTLEEMLPRTLEVKVNAIKDLEEYEKPLNVSYEVNGTMGTSAGKRMVVPADLFLSDEKATFPHEKRDVAVYFSYPRIVQDALRINFHNGLVVEATPTSARYDLPKTGSYTMEVTSTPTSFTTRRNFIFNDIFVLPPEYPQLRGFYAKFESNDQQSVVLKADAAAGAAKNNTATAPAEGGH